MKMREINIWIVAVILVIVIHIGVGLENEDVDIRDNVNVIREEYMDEGNVEREEEVDVVRIGIIETCERRVCSEIGERVKEEVIEYWRDFGIEIEYREIKAYSEVPRGFKVSRNGMDLKKAAIIEAIVINRHRKDDIDLYIVGTEMAERLEVLGLYIRGTDYVMWNKGIVKEEVKAATISHELGHAWGLGHVEDARNLMNDVSLGVKNLELTVEQIQTIYFTLLVKYGIKAIPISY